MPHPAKQGALGSLLALMAVQPEAVRVAYRARHWACALDILELAAMAASAGEAAATAVSAAAAAAAESTAREFGGLLASHADDGGTAAASWSEWSQQLLAQHKECVSYTQGTHNRFSAYPVTAPSTQE